MRLRDAELSDLPAIRDLLADANDTPYELERVAAEKCFEEGPHGRPRTLLANLDGEIGGLVTLTHHGVRLLAVRRARRRLGVGTTLLRLAEERADASISRIAIYAEAGNYYLPGVPESDAGTLRFFDALGYQRHPEVASNLEASLESLPAEKREAVERASPGSRPEIVDFIAARFSHIWAYEAARALVNDPPTLFVARRGGRMVGFAAHEANNRGLGFFGPMGVGAEARGSGIGRALLLASLLDLRRLGHRSAVISWAANPDFYARACGARPSLRMVRFSKERSLHVPPPNQDPT